jgi:ABC-type hemin transport system ATPase subunit
MQGAHICCVCGGGGRVEVHTRSAVVVRFQWAGSRRSSIPPHHHLAWLFFCGVSAVPEEAIVAATRALSIYDQIMALPGGLDSTVGTSGVGLSGGERQRVLLANALLRLVFQGSPYVRSRPAPSTNPPTLLTATTTTPTPTTAHIAVTLSLRDVLVCPPPNPCALPHTSPTTPGGQLLVVDEATSGMDSMADSSSMAFVVDLCAALGVALVVVTHRLSSVCPLCDCVVAMEGGRVSAVAPHDQQLVCFPGGVYAQLWFGQLHDDQRSSASTVVH